MELNELQKDCARRQKRGLHFILASIVIWGMILAIQLTNLTTEQKNLAVFCCSAVLFPLAWGLSKMLKIDFEGKGNPLTKAGILFSINQMLYILIAMWVYAAVPEKMVMVYAMIFGAHLMPFSWLYQSNSYMCSLHVCSGSAPNRLFRLYMNGNMRLGAVVLLQQALHLGGFVVSLVQSDIAVHENV